MTGAFDDATAAADALANLLDRTAGRPLTRDETRLERRYRSQISAALNTQEEW